MAHIGKTYRLAFRRDLSLQTRPNAVGWPYQMRPILNNAYGSVASPASGLPWLILLNFDDTTGELTGESQHLSVGGVVAYCKIHGVIVGDPKHYKVEMQWFKEPGVMLFERTVMNTIPAQYNSFGADRSSGVTFQTTGVFQSDPSSPALDGFVAKFWH